MDIMKATPVKIIALIAALLAAVWVGVMISDGPTTKTAEVSQEQVDEFRDGQWGETSPMESSNGFKATNVPVQGAESDAETKATLDQLQWEWENAATERDRVATCADYRTWPEEVVQDLFAQLMMAGSYADPGELANWVYTVCGEY